MATKRLITAVKASLLALIFSSIFLIPQGYAAVSVGDSYDGGTVFCVSQTPDIKQCVPQGSGNFGLIMANEDQVNFDSNSKHGVTWAGKNDAIPAARSDDDGAANTAAIIAAHPQDNPGNNAAWLCRNYRGGGKEGWYLPSKNELNKMYLYAKANNLIGKGCAGRKVGGVQCLIGGGDYSGNTSWNEDNEYKIYWSSTEYSGCSYIAWSQYFSDGVQRCYREDGNWLGVRAVRAFNNLTIQQFNNLQKLKIPSGVALAVEAKDSLPNATSPHCVAVPAPAVTPAAVAPKQKDAPQAVPSAKAKEQEAAQKTAESKKQQAAVAPVATAATSASATTVPAHTDTCRFTFGAVGERLARIGDLPRLYPPGYQPPTLVQAMADAGVPSPEGVLAACDDVVACAVADGTVNCTKLTREDAAAIAMYTFDFGGNNRDRNPYRIINGGLYERNTLQLRELRGLIYRLLHALRSVQPVQPQALFRGIKDRVKLDDAHYHKGNKITWHTFSSTTPDMETTKLFLTDQDTGKCEGTLFIITGTPWGYNIKPFSCFPDEEEILLEPEIELRVTGVLDTPMIVVNLEMLPDQRLLLERLIPRNIVAIGLGSSPTVAAVAPAASAQYKRCIALADWESTIAGGLSFKKGDVINIIDAKGEWWTGELNGKRGWVPPNYLKPDSPAPAPQTF